MMRAKAWLQGSHRVAPPERTWERIAPALPRAGITRVADVTRLDGIGIPTFQAVRPGSRNLSVSQGKGITPAAARVSAAMESLEMWHAEDLSALPRVTLSPLEMEFDNPVTLRDLRWRIGNREILRRPLEWIRATRLGGEVGAEAGGEGGAWIPRKMLELGFLFEGGFEPRPFQLTSNGLASGNCDEEALVHALCELVERDSLSRVQTGESRPVPLDLRGSGSSWLESLVDRLEEATDRWAAWDATTPLGLPVVLVDLMLDDLPLAFRGSGCHPSPAVAASRAVTEAAQSRLTYISGAREDIRFDSPRWRDLSPDRFPVEPPERSVSELADLATDTVAGDLRIVLDRLRRGGFEAFAVSLRRAEIDLPVWFAFVPGLREARHG